MTHSVKVRAGVLICGAVFCAAIVMVCPHAAAETAGALSNIQPSVNVTASADPDDIIGVGIRDGGVQRRLAPERSDSGS